MPEEAVGPEDVTRPVATSGPNGAGPVVRAAEDRRAGGRVTPLRLLTAIVTLFGLLALMWSVLALPGDFAGVARESWWWLLPAVAGAAATYLASGQALRAVVVQPLPVLRTWVVLVAESFTTMATPGGVGSLAITVDYLRRSGLETAAATSSAALCSMSRGLLELVAFPVLLAISFSSGNLASLHHGPGDAQLWIIAGVLVAVAVGTVIVVRVPALRRRAGPSLQRAGRNLSLLVHHPTMLVRLVACQVGWIALQAAVLLCALQLVGASAPLAPLAALVILAYLAQRTVPLPGALGAPEAVLIAGLTGIGVPAAPAVAAVASYRMLTYWLPPVPGVLILALLRRRSIV